MREINNIGALCHPYKWLSEIHTHMHDSSLTPRPRNQHISNFGQLLAILESQKTIKIDTFAPASAIHASNGALELFGTRRIDYNETENTADGRFQPTAAADEQIAHNLRIPAPYLAQLRHDGRLDLYDANVNGMLHGPTALSAPDHRHNRIFLLRLFAPNPHRKSGVVRAVLADTATVVDHLDALGAMVQGIRRAGAYVEMYSADLTDEHLTCSIFSPSLSLLANMFDPPRSEPDETTQSRTRMLDWARRRFGSRTVGSFLGVRISNSETGHRLLTVTPELVLSDHGQVIAFPELSRIIQPMPGFGPDTVAVGAHTFEDRMSKIAEDVQALAQQWLTPTFLTHLAKRLRGLSKRPLGNRIAVLNTVTRTLELSTDERHMLDALLTDRPLSAADLVIACSELSRTADPDRAAKIEISSFQIARRLAARAAPARADDTPT
ncbi:hypothetical protein [Nocardia aurantiaca]|uniref:Uncharacterized protein n=1 Tax=Nocardia aurantiaca TaxID=2675850 RepID=A0A6I3L785_9NOCA|nr:hypothetical protein [Nocardia aurantiaca]MTE17381.1 hypothetical protein [Nocardia aurantiaca]